MDVEVDNFLNDGEIVPVRVATNDTAFSTLSKNHSTALMWVSPEKNTSHTDYSLLRTHVRRHQVAPLNHEGRDCQPTITKKQLRWKYFNLILAKTQVAGLIDQFLVEPYGLIESDTTGKAFTFNECLNRMQTGCLVGIVDYNDLKKKDLYARLTHDKLVLSSQLGSISEKNEIKFQDMKGIVIGKITSTLRNYVKSMKENTGHQGTFKAFSIIGKAQTYDFITKSETVQYDMCVTLSMLIHLHTQKLTCMPIGKSIFY